MASMYEPVWVKLKREKEVSIRVEVKTGDRESFEQKFRRIRKALSHRKLVDLEFCADNPNARIEVASSDAMTGNITFKLVYENPGFSLLDLTTED